MARDTPILVTLQPSSGVDTSRWLLSHYGVDYQERAHAPIFHILALKYWGAGPEDYPLLVMPDDEKIPGRMKIGPWLDAQAADELRLIPDETSEPEDYKQVMKLAEWAGNVPGSAVVNWSYFNLLKYKRTVWSSLVTHVPWYEKLITFLAFPLIRLLMYKGLGLNQQVADDSLKTIYESFDKIDAMLADGREFLVGGKLSFADFSVSGLLGPMILIQGYQGHLPNQVDCPDYMQKVYKELRQRPAGLFIQRMYDQHRKPSGTVPAKS